MNAHAKEPCAMRGVLCNADRVIVDRFLAKRSRVYKTIIKEQKRLCVYAAAVAAAAETKPADKMRAVEPNNENCSAENYLCTVRVKEAFRIHYYLNAICNFRLISLKCSVF